MKKLFLIYLIFFTGLVKAKDYIDLTVLATEPVFKTALKDVMENPAKKAEVISEIKKIWELDNEKTQLLELFFNMFGLQMRDCMRGQASEEFISTFKMFGVPQKDIEMMTSKEVFPIICKAWATKFNTDDISKITLANLFTEYGKYVQRQKRAKNRK